MVAGECQRRHALLPRLPLKITTTTVRRAAALFAASAAIEMLAAPKIIATCRRARGVVWQARRAA